MQTEVQSFLLGNRDYVVRKMTNKQFVGSANSMETAVDFPRREGVVRAVPAAPVFAPELERIIRLVMDGVRAERSRRAYAHAVAQYLDWCAAHNLRIFWKPTVQQYRAHLDRR